MPIKQPVHVHGLFSISPDLPKLYQLREDSSQDQSPAIWNEWLLHNPVPMAWAKLLSHLAYLRPDEPTFEWWPQNTDGNNDILSNALDRFVDIVTKDSLSLWSMCVGPCHSSQGSAKC
jgi:sacsin